MGLTVTRALVDWQGLTLTVSRMAWSLWMLMRGPWHVNHRDRLVLQEGSKGPLLQGACDSKPLARESIDRVRIHSETSPMHGPPCQHPPCKASTPAVTRGAPPGNSRCESTQHTALHTPFTRLRGPWPVAAAVAGPGCLMNPKRQP